MVPSRRVGLLPVAFAIVLVLAVALAVPGCTVGPDYSSPETDTPEHWAGLDGQDDASQASVVSAVSAVSEQGRVDAAEWWLQFDDPLLTSLIARADGGNLSLAQAQARIRQARAARTVVASGALPQVAAGASYTRSHGNAGSSGDIGSDQFILGFDASWELDLFGGVRRGVEAAEAQIESAFFDEQSILVTVNAEVAAEYLALRGLQKQLVIARQNLEAQRQTLELTQQRFDAGLVSRLDVANAKAQVEQTVSQIPAFEAQAQSAIFAISVLLGEEPGALLAELTPEQALPSIPARVPVGLPSELLRRRPDIRRADADLHAATADIGVALADQYPQFSLTGSFGTEGSQIDSLGRLADRFWSFGPSASVPLFTGGRVQGTIEVARAGADEALLAYRSAVLAALQDVDTSLVAFTREQERRAALEQSADASTQAVAAALDLYGAGQTDFLNVLTAQGQLYATQTALAQSETAVGTDLVSLYKTLGGGWPVADPSADSGSAADVGSAVDVGSAP